MHTLAQASATFIAILAGFYTNKVLSIASEKNRLAAKIKEIQNEVEWRKDYATEIRKKVDEIDNRANEEFVGTFRNFIVDSHFDGLPTPNEIKENFRKYAAEVYSDNLQSILEKQIPSIIEDIKKHREAESSGEKYVRYHPSESETQIDAIYGAHRVRSRNELVRESDQELGRALFLETQLKDVKREFDSLAFPKYIKFGFTSLVVYAALGVIFPLTYGIWGKYLLEDNVDLMFLIFHANDIALLLFVIGLSLTLVYIALELIHALESKDLVSKRKSVNEH